jgi:hypothetical protein
MRAAPLRSRSCILDGEAAACGDGGIALFERIRYRPELLAKSQQLTASSPESFSFYRKFSWHSVAYW